MAVKCYLCGRSLADDQVMTFNDYLSSSSNWDKNPGRERKIVGIQCWHCHASFCNSLHRKELNHNFISGYARSKCPHCGYSLKNELNLIQIIDKVEKNQPDPAAPGAGPLTTRQALSQSVHKVQPEKKDIPANLKTLLIVLIGVSSFGLIGWFAATRELSTTSEVPPTYGYLTAIMFLLFLIIPIWAWVIKRNELQRTSVQKKVVKALLFLVSLICLGVPIAGLSTVLVTSAISVSQWESSSSSGALIVNGLPIPLSGDSINYLLLAGLYVFFASIIFGLISLLIKALQAIRDDF